MDNLTPKERSALMAKVRSKDTKPEMAVRRLVHGMGYRYRLHCAALPGRPDLAFASRKKAILVHGCFWHGHAGCPAHRIPKTRRAYWKAKIEGNQARDKLARGRLKRLGWGTMVVWECETKRPEKLARRLARFLG